MSKSKIEWTDKTWNPVTGCTKVSEGCANCYAERLTKRFWPERDFSQIQLYPGRLDEPLRWKKPCKVFVCSMGDLFHEDVPDEFLHQVFAVMRVIDRHTYLVLTKRPERMAAFLKDYERTPLSANKHIWLGVTAENQEQADKRIPILLSIPAAVRFVSVEPMLGPVDLRKHLTYDCDCGICNFCNGGKPLDMVNWVICGGESGPGARPMSPDWARNLRDQCVAAEVPFFLKQMHVEGKLIKMPELDGQEWNQEP